MMVCTAACGRLIRTTPQVSVEGQQALLFCSNNYLGLAEHPALAQAAADAALQYGTSSAASRLVSGNQPLHDLLEAKLAAWKGTETALLFNSGYAANTGIIAALAGRGDIIFSDRLNHASIIDGALLSGARLVRYPHNDTQALARLLEQHQTDGLRLIVTDGVFSMDGDIAPLTAIADLAEQYQALLMVDDAHAGGVLGQQGRGTVDFCGVTGRVAIQMGTFGKALGSFGAYAACSRSGAGVSDQSFPFIDLFHLPATGSAGSLSSSS
jgi:7-keto-8-aminopelargonate synthetase-like enzyme